MHTISSGDKVLVTGANGFIAMWIVRKLLEKGYAVRGTVRSADKAKYLEEYFKAYGHKFEFMIVEDIAKSGAFDEAVKELLEPAVNGTVGILKSALAYGQEVKRVVVISSVAAVSDFSVYKLLNEDDWNEPSVIEIKEKGADAAGYVKYYASKTAAERAAWQFYEDNKTGISWDLSVLNPSYVFGPPVHELKSSDALGTSLRLWYDVVVVGGQTEDFLKTGLAFIDVRDVAEANVLALENEAAGGERIIISAGPFIWQQWVDVANSLSLPIPSHSKLPIGYPGLADTAKLPVEFDTRKAARILGLTYLNQEQVTRDSLTDFVKRGWY
ncbi:NADPH-dependent methylglyoxal reductase GRE2 [Termitomyces sp. T112]|nr:NADPH-dependent methylglyoxal reductase GRE2 [Termitomyces sp. T112]